MWRYEFISTFHIIFPPYLRGESTSHIVYYPGEDDSSEERTGNWKIESLSVTLIFILLNSATVALRPKHQLVVA